MNTSVSDFTTPDKLAQLRYGYGTYLNEALNNTMAAFAPEIYNFCPLLV